MMDIVYSKRGYVERENAEALIKRFFISLCLNFGRRGQ